MNQLRGGPDKVKPFIETCKQMLREGKTMEDVLSFLRRQGLYKLDAILAITMITDIESRDAKRIVHLSKTWADTRDDDEDLHGIIREHTNMQD